MQIVCIVRQHLSMDVYRYVIDIHCHTYPIMATAKIGITIDEGLLQRVDDDRGMVPRSRFLSKIVADSYQKEGKKK